MGSEFLSSVELDDIPYYILCILSSANGHLGYFQAWAALSNAVMSNVVSRPLSVLDFVTSEDVSKIEIVESYNKFYNCFKTLASIIGDEFSLQNQRVLLKPERFHSIYTGQVVIDRKNCNIFNYTVSATYFPLKNTTKNGVLNGQCWNGIGI